MDIAALVESMKRTSQFQTVINNPLAAFGRGNRRYLGQEILPERRVPQNEYTETGIRYRTVIANDGTRYSPVQLKQGTLSGSFRVSLGHQDIGSEFTSRDYDALLEMIGPVTGDNPPMRAVANLLDWLDKTVNLPLIERMELQRWQAIVAASVVRTGDDGYSETVTYPNPTGHRVAAGGVWSNNAYDPYADIIAGAEKLRTKGYEVSRVITSTPVASKLSNNLLVKTRVGRVSVISGTVVGLPGRASREEINSLLGEDNIPPIETYDLTYNTQDSTGYFLAQTVFVMVGTTGLEEEFDPGGDTEQLESLKETLGYAALGRAAGQQGPGRVAVVNAFENKPPRIEGEGWQASIPVILEPEAIYVITGIS